MHPVSVFELLNDVGVQCGSLIIFQSLSFCVKSILGIPNRSAKLILSKILTTEKSCDFHTKRDENCYRNFIFFLQDYFQGISISLHYLFISSLCCQLNMPAALYAELSWKYCQKEFKAFLISKSPKKKNKSANTVCDFLFFSFFFDITRILHRYCHTLRVT